MLNVNINNFGGSKTKPAPTHWSNQFGFRQRVTATPTTQGKPTAVLPTDLLELIGVKPGEEVVCSVDNLGRIVVVRPEVQFTD